MDRNNNQWVYYNGELYHAGVKGMQWGKHLPGTDWWKETTQKYYSQGNSNTTRVKDVDEKGRVTFRNKNTPTFGQRVKANLYTAGKAANLYGRYGKVLAGHAINSVSKSVTRAGKKIKHKVAKYWNKGKGYTQEQIAKFQTSARESYAKVRNAVRNYYLLSGAKTQGRHQGVNGNSLLNDEIKKQAQDAKTVYDAFEKGGVFNTINLAFQTSQYNAVKGCKKFLRDIGMDDEVNTLLRKLNLKG